MPRFDGTGPDGRGPLTGRGMGPCANRMGRGLGRARGGCPRFLNQGSEQLNENDLNNYKEELEKELEVIKKELGNIKK